MIRCLDDTGSVGTRCRKFSHGHAINRVNKVRRDLVKWDKNEPAFLKLRMWDLDLIVRKHQTIVHQEIDIDLTRTPTLGRSPSHMLLDTFDLFKQSIWLKGSFDLCHSVEKLWLTRFSLWLGFIYRRSPDQFRFLDLRHRNSGLIQVSLSISQVGAKAQEHIVHFHRRCVISTST